MSVQREFAKTTVHKLRAAGFEALWAGGCVRDLLLGIDPKDYDIATSARPEEIRKVFGYRRTLPIGAAFGVITLVGNREQGQLEIATYREDLSYSDGRRPDAVSFSTAEADASRRDITINGIFYDPVAERYIDYVDGTADLEQRVIRAIGEPHARITEDKLRMLRAIRFAAALEFEIEPATFAAIRDMATEIEVVSGERIGAELGRMLEDASRSEAIRLLAASDLLRHVIEPLGSWYAQASNHEQADYLRVLARLDCPSRALATAAALLPLGNPGATRAIGRQLRMTNHDIDRMAWLMSHLDTLAQATTLRWSQLQPLLANEGGSDLVALRQALAGSEDPQARYCRERLAVPPEQLDPRPLLDGSDLIAAGFKPGRQFSELLGALREAQLDGIISTPAAALRWLTAQEVGRIRKPSFAALATPALPLIRSATTGQSLHSYTIVVSSMSSWLFSVVFPLFVLGIVSRVTHLVSAAIIVGGLFYLRTIVVPSADQAAAEGDDLATRYFGTQRKHWGMAIGISTLLLMVSGTYNLVTILQTYQLPMAYHILLTVKLLLAMFVFFAAAIVAGRSAGAVRARIKIRSWLDAALLASVVLIGVASTMRALIISRKLSRSPP